MIPKHSRLTKQTIENYLLKARRVKTSCFFVAYNTIPGAKRPQISVSCSKKVAPTAVLRNKLRRRAYSALSPIIPTLPSNFIALVSYNKADTDISINDLRAELSDCFSKICKK